MLSSKNGFWSQTDLGVNLLLAFYVACFKFLKLSSLHFFTCNKEVMILTSWVAVSTE